MRPKQMMISVTSSKGLSLLELVVCVAILGIGITTVARALSSCAGLTGFYGDIVNALLLIEDKMQDLEYKENNHTINSIPKTNQESEGKFNLGYNMEVDRDKPELYKIDLKVQWQRKNRQQDISITSLLRK